MERAGWDVFWAAMRRWTPQFRLEGFIEPARRAYTAGVGPWGQMWADGTRWSGRPGQPLAELEPARKPPTTFDPWWYLDALRGVSQATVEGEGRVRETPCRRLAVRIDMARASAAAPAGLQASGVDRFEELLSLPLDVWIDGTHVRRVRYFQGPGTSTLELWDFGVSTEGLDWSRLPSWESSDGTEKPRQDGSLVRRLLKRARGRGRATQAT